MSTMDSNHDGNHDISEDDELGSWEEMEESGALDERLEKQLKMSGDRDRQSAQAPIRLQEDSTRTAYQPQLKILKRQPGYDATCDADRESKQAATKTKSLAEREAAYAEARKRIMGPGTSDEDSRQSLTLAKPSTSNTRQEAKSEKKLAKGKR